MAKRSLEEERRRRSLDELEGAQPPPEPVSHLVTECHRLRTKALGELTVEDLRILIGQSLSLQFLMPFALDVLEREPLAEGDLYPGDLLLAVLRADAEHWRRNPAQRARLAAALAGVHVPSNLEDALRAWLPAS